MTEEDKQRIIDLVEQIQEILPEFDSFIYTGESIIISSIEHIQDIAENSGLDLEVEYSEQELLEWDGDDDDGYGNNGGGMLQ